MTSDSDKCSKGHSNWITYPSGKRRCRTCHNDGNRRRRNGGVVGTVAFGFGKNTGDRGGREETFSYSEIMKARGYVK